MGTRLDSDLLEVVSMGLFLGIFFSPILLANVSLTVGILISSWMEEGRMKMYYV